MNKRGQLNVSAADITSFGIWLVFGGLIFYGVGYGLYKWLLDR